MKYMINYDDNTVCECKVLQKGKDEFGEYFVCLVYDDIRGIEDEVECYAVYDSKDAAYDALNEFIESDIESQKYAAGYCYACGYYD